MPTPLKILAPIDLDRNPRAAVVHAVHASRYFGGDLTLLHVLDEKRWRRGGPFEWPSEARDAAGECRIRKVVLSGPVAQTIAECAETLDADIISAVTHRTRGWTRLWKPSLADQIVGGTERPVCVANAKAVGREPVFRNGRILCVLALDGTDGPVLRFAEALASRNGAELVLLNVVPEQSESLLAHGIAWASRRPLSRSCAAQRMRETARVIACRHITAIVAGPTEASIVRAVREYDTGLAVAGRQVSYSVDPCSADLRTLFARISCPVVCVTTQSRSAGVRVDAGVWHRVSRLAFRSHA
jgi:nucleotide-binding universal stress UspA family protein